MAALYKTSSRRPSEIKRKPVPKLTHEEMLEMTVSSTPSASTSSPSLVYTPHVSNLQVDNPSVQSFSPVSTPSPLFGKTRQTCNPLTTEDVDCGCDGDDESGDERELSQGSLWKAQFGVAELESDENRVRLSNYSWRSPQLHQRRGTAATNTTGLPYSVPETPHLGSSYDPRRLSVESGSSSTSAKSYGTTISRSDSIFDDDGELDEYHRAIARQTSMSSNGSAGMTIPSPHSDKEALSPITTASQISIGHEPSAELMRSMTSTSTKFSSMFNGLRVPLGASNSAVHEKKLKKMAVIKEEVPFTTYLKPSGEALSAAAEATVYDEHGEAIRFGSLWETQRTIVCFIRHYWYVPFFF